MGAAAIPIAIAQAGISLSGAYLQSQAQKEQGKYEQQVAESNARMAEENAKDAVLRGRTEAGQVLRRGRSIKGAQRAALAGQGVDVGTGTPADLQTETDSMGTLDAMTVQNNAWREAWGYKAEASNERIKGRFARFASKTEARNTLLTGGLQAANSLVEGAYRYKRNT